MYNVFSMLFRFNGKSEHLLSVAESGFGDDVMDGPTALLLSHSVLVKLVNVAGCVSHLQLVVAFIKEKSGFCVDLVGNTRAACL